MSWKSKILIIGGTGYLGKFMVKASISMGHPTYVYSRPSTKASDSSSKIQVIHDFESMGVHIIQGYLDDYDKLLSVFQQIDVVISLLPVPQHLEQLRIIDAIKEVGNIKRFFPSEFGVESRRAHSLRPFQRIIDNKKEIQRAIKEGGIPYTIVAGNGFGAYFVDYLLNPQHQRDEITIYGDGHAKAVLNFEEDIAAFTIRSVDDVCTLNRLVICKPPKNIISQLDMISLREKRCRKTLKKRYISEEEVIKLIESLPHPENVGPAILHYLFVAGQSNLELEEDDLELSNLYPDYKYTPIVHLIDVLALNPSHFLKKSCPGIASLDRSFFFSKLNSGVMPSLDRFYFFLQNLKLQSEDGILELKLKF
ncbi:hypothetical protein AMTRI_Chr11g97760 [Amborella trichopoda]